MRIECSSCGRFVIEAKDLDTEEEERMRDLLTYLREKGCPVCESLYGVYSPE